MKTHALKVHPQFWNAVATGEKTFEVRRNDRQFAVGDIVRLFEYNPRFGFVDNRLFFEYNISYILYAEDFPLGLKPGYVVLGFRK